MTKKPSVKAQGLCFAYGLRLVLQEVTLEAWSGELLGIIGPNGAGKTTFLNIVNGTLKPQRGRVYLGGVEVASLWPQGRARMVATVPQSPTVPPGFSALGVVMMGRNPHLGLFQWESARDLAVCHRVMEMTDTWELANRPIITLSGGERQRVFIARALAQEAPLLLLDEPTAHLDIGYQSTIMDMIRDIQKETRVTIVAAMHDLSLAGQYCDRIAVLHQGAVCALGLPQEVLTPEVVSKVFGAQVATVRHPVHHTPVVLPVSGDRHRGVETPISSEA